MSCLQSMETEKERPSQSRSATYIGGFLISAVKWFTCQKNNGHHKVLLHYNLKQHVILQSVYYKCNL